MNDYLAACFLSLTVITSPACLLVLAVCRCTPVCLADGAAPETAAPPTAERMGMALPIETQRQLFLDDQVIAETAELTREQGRPIKHSANPVLRRDQPWDAMRCELSGSAVWDPERNRVRLFYSATGKLYPEGQFSGMRDRDSCLALAESVDGVTWTKPTFDLFPYDGIPQTGIVLGLWQGADWIHGPGVCLDPHDRDPARHYKLFTTIAHGIHVFFSPDGIHWTPSRKNPVIPWHSDTGNCPFRDPETGKYVTYVRMRTSLGVRCVGRVESDDFEDWSAPQIVYAPDEQECARRWQFYQHSVTPYRGLYVGLTHLFETGSDMDPASSSPIIWPVLTVSRDGVRWTRVLPDDPGRPFLPTGEPGAFDSRMIRTASSLVVLPDRLLLLYGGSPNIHHRTCTWEIGLATLRVDGFVCLRAGDEEGTLLTRPLQFDAGRLHINAAVQPGGYVKAALLPAGQAEPLADYDANLCRAVTGDSISTQVVWAGRSAIPAATGHGIRIRFLLKKAKLYSFWVEG